MLNKKLFISMGSFSSIIYTNSFIQNIISRHRIMLQEFC